MICFECSTIQFIHIKIAPYKNKANFWVAETLIGSPLFDMAPKSFNAKLFLNNEVVVHRTIIGWTMCTYIDWRILKLHRKI